MMSFLASDGQTRCLAMLQGIEIDPNTAYPANDERMKCIDHSSATECCDRFCHNSGIIPEFCEISQVTSRATSDVMHCDRGVGEGSIRSDMGNEKAKRNRRFSVSDCRTLVTNDSTAWRIR
jgi:hypothetical protein